MIEMTPKEAIDIVEDVTWQDNGRHYGKIVPARKLVISALEKQIPKKATAKITQRGYDVDFDLRCPICGAVVGTFEEGVNEYFSKYCDNCGQALDWSDTE